MLSRLNIKPVLFLQLNKYKNTELKKQIRWYIFYTKFIYAVCCIFTKF